MTDKSKSSVLRPKVRFSQSAEFPNSPDGGGAFSKPRIRSVVDFKGPTVNILKAPVADFDRGLDREERNFTHTADDAPNDLRLCPSKSPGGSAPCLTEIILTPENRALRNKNFYDTGEMPEGNVTQIAPSKSCHKEVELPKKNPSLENCTYASKSTTKFSRRSLPANTKLSQKVPNIARSISQTRQSTSKVGKENVCKVQKSEDNIPVVPDNTPRTRSDVGAKSSTSRSNSMQVSYRKKETFSKTKEAEVNKKTAKTTTLQPARRSMNEIGLMPCMKATKSRSKSAPIKKTILRDVSSSRSNVYVGPGMARKNSPEPEAQVDSHRSRSEILSGDKLARPEYNSIIGTIKKLQHLREEKVIKNLENLPAVYRGLVNGKVSSALDFGANEAIYKDLVDLSIDEKQLPSRLTRSKDPEPRQKDLVPKLTDFFVPTSEEEYRKAVLPRPPSPRVLDIWNPYKISDRIFAWKESLDHNI